VILRVFREFVLIIFLYEQSSRTIVIYLYI